MMFLLNGYINFLEDNPNILKTFRTKKGLGSNDYQITDTDKQSIEYLAKSSNFYALASEELKNAMTAVQTEYNRNRAQRNAVYNMQQVLISMRDKYENGLIEFSDLLKTEQDLLEAQTTLASSNGAIYQNIIAFYKATGGGYN